MSDTTPTNIVCAASAGCTMGDDLIPVQTTIVKDSFRASEINKGTIPLQFHIPAPILAKIASFLADGGTTALKNLILAGPEGKEAVFSKETLSQIRLDRDPEFVRMSQPGSPYFNLYRRCLEERNPYALFVESLRLAFCVSDLAGAIKITKGIKDAFPVAGLLHIMLSSCSGVEDIETLEKFKRHHHTLEDVESIGDALIALINLVGPKRADTYLTTWSFDFYPECWQYHWWNMDIDGRCTHCIYYYLSRDIRHLS